MLESRKQQERGRKVARDSTLQGKSRKADAKWMTVRTIPEETQRAPWSVVSSSPFCPPTHLARTEHHGSESPLMRLKMTGYNFSRKMTVGLTERSSN